MPTNPLPDAACNMPLFVPKTERAYWGRLTYITESASRNQFMQDVLVAGLRAKGLSDWAEKIEAARAEYKGLAITAAKAAVTALMVGWVAVAALFGADVRRSKTGVRIVRTVRTARRSEFCTFSI